MRIFITGGTGYLGLSIIESLGLRAICHKQQLDIQVLDVNLPPVNFQGEFARIFGQYVKLEFISGDVCQPDQVKPLADKSDVIIHLAFVVGGPACKKKSGFGQAFG